MIIWKQLVGQCSQCVKEPTNEVDRNVVTVVCTNSLYKYKLHSPCNEEVVGHAQQKSP